MNAVKSGLRGNFRRQAVWAMKRAGLFERARRSSRSELRILGFHALSTFDEHRYDDVLFQTQQTFENRIALLERVRADVLSLDEALVRLDKGTLPDLPVVITIDDGWASTFTTALPLLRAKGLPATVYVSTNYVEHPQLKVSDVALGYTFFKARHAPTWCDLRDVHYALRSLAAEHQDALLFHARRLTNQLSIEAREEVVIAVADKLGVDLGPISRARGLQYASADELAAAAAAGVDLQLHTHSHRMPDDPRAFAADIVRNRTLIEKLSGRACRDLCFPSGEYSQAHLQALPGLSVRSATTCHAGMNGYDASPFELRRHLDRERFSDLEFEAELTGVTEWIRTARRGARDAVRAAG